MNDDHDDLMDALANALVDTLPNVHMKGDLLRVSISSVGKFYIVDFTVPGKTGRVLFRDAPQEAVPKWIIEAVSMLRIADPRSVVAQVGFKVTDRLYYVVDKREEQE